MPAHADPVTDLQMRHTCADFDYRSRRFVPEHHRLVDDEGADLAVRVIVHIRPADTDRMNLDLHWPGPTSWGRSISRIASSC